MSYIKESKENPFTLWDFYNNTKFIVHSDCKYCHILLTNYRYNDNNECTEVEVIVWVPEPDKGHGRYTISIEEVPIKIDMRKLLLEIAKTFGKSEFDEEYCYIKVESEKRNFTF